jgi:hypothetical protein
VDALGVVDAFRGIEAAVAEVDGTEGVVVVAGVEGALGALDMFATSGADAANILAPTCPWPSIGRCQNTFTNLFPNTASSDFHAAWASS